MGDGFPSGLLLRTVLYNANKKRSASIQVRNIKWRLLHYYHLKLVHSCLQQCMLLRHVQALTLQRNSVIYKKPQKQDTKKSEIKAPTLHSGLGAVFDFVLVCI